MHFIARYMSRSTCGLRFMIVLPLWSPLDIGSVSHSFYAYRCMYPLIISLDNSTSELHSDF